MWPDIESNTSFFVAPSFKERVSSKAYNFKKYLCGFPFGGQGPQYPISPKSFLP